MPGAGSESERRAEECYLNVLVQIYELFPTYARKLLFFSVQFVKFLGKLRDFIGNLRFLLLFMIHRINKLSRCYLALAVIDLGAFAFPSFPPQLHQ